MKSTTVRLLTLAIASVVVAPAMGQYRVGDDGRALDASNRVGSGGRNDGGASVNNSPYQGNVTGNQIVTGNVTGGREFRGNINYTDPSAFRGNVAGQNVDRFIRNSAGIGDVRNPNFNLSNPKPFYGQAETVEPPAGFVQQRYTGAYVPSPLISGTGEGDLRLDRPIDMPLMDTTQPGELILPGPVDSTNQQTLLTASPLYGVRQWRLGEQNDRDFLDNYTSLRQQQQPDALGRMRLSDEEVAKMRAELGPQTDQGPGAAQTPADGSGNVGGQLSLDNPFGQPSNPQVQAQAGDLSTGQGSRSRLLVPAPEQQSTQYAELQSRLKRRRELLNGNRPQNDIEAHQEFMEQVRLKEQLENETQQAKRQQQQQEQNGGGAAAAGAQPRSGAEAVGIPDFAKMNQETLEQRQQANAANQDQQQQGTPSDLTPQSVDEAARKAQEAEQANRPAPLKIRSLAEGVKAKGLSDFLKTAEDLMKQGKFTSALEQYEAAEQVAPNNPLVQLGRANAELGASYYARAEAHLRQAFLSDPALLMGQYDLREFLGQERLQFLVRDLKEIANTEKKQARPVFLLAYLAYNTDNERQAAGYLELAEQRAGSTDPLYPLLRQYWNLPTAPADANK